MKYVCKITHYGIDYLQTGPNQKQ